MDKRHSTGKISLILQKKKSSKLLGKLKLKSISLSVTRTGLKTESLQEEDTTDATSFQVVRNRWFN